MGTQEIGNLIKEIRTTKKLSLKDIPGDCLSVFVNQANSKPWWKIQRMPTMV